MFSKLRARLTYANVMATFAVFIATPTEENWSIEARVVRVNVAP